MCDLLQILPSFPHGPFASLLTTIENRALTTTDLLTQHPADIAKQTQLPILDLKRLIAAIQASLSDDIKPRKPLEDVVDRAAAAAAAADRTISTLDDGLDAALSGGIPVGCVSEVTGEGGAGKTQFLLSLCLAVQLPEPRGLGKQALYISTESALATRRLAQMLASNPVLQDIEAEFRPTLDGIHSAVTPDLESQDHILEFQVPVLLSRHNIGLIILDSVAANYRAEFERQGSHGSNMAARSSELVRLGALLRRLARTHNLAVVVANQVADRFAPAPLPRTQMIPVSSGITGEDSPLASRTRPPPPGSYLPNATPSSSLPFHLQDPDGPPAPPALMLDHQQRWFTGWGDDPHASYALKTPSLGLVWSTQIACRLALLKRPIYGRTRQAAPLDAADDEADLNAPTLKTWKRWMKVVFAPHTAASGQGLVNAVEFVVHAGGLQTVKKETKLEKQ